MMNLYGTPVSSNTNKVRYVVSYLGIDSKFININLGAGEHRNAEFLAINPFGRVPAIEDNGFTLAESDAIIRYLATKHNSTLYPTDIKERAKVDEWIDYASKHISIPMSKIMYNTYFYKKANTEIDERSLQDGHSFLNKNLPQVEKQLSSNPYITGNNITLADMTLLSALDPSELSKVDLSIYPNITKWRNKLMNEQFYQNIHQSYTDFFNKLTRRS